MKGFSKSLRIFTFYYLPLIIWCGLIFYLSSRPVFDVSTSSFIDYWTHQLAHLVEFAILGIFSFRVVNLRHDSHQSAKKAFLLSFFYGIFDEIHQLFVPTRSFKIMDIVFDGLGALIGIWVIIVKNQRQKKL